MAERGGYWRSANMDMLVTCARPTRGAAARPLYSLYSHIDHLASVGVSIVIYEDAIWSQIVAMWDYR